MFQKHAEVLLIYKQFIIYTFTSLLYIHKTFKLFLKFNLYYIFVSSFQISLLWKLLPLHIVTDGKWILNTKHKNSRQLELNFQNMRA